MKKILTAMFLILATSSSVSSALAFTRYTYDNYGNRNGTVRSYYPGIASRYDANGKKIGTYVTNRNGITRGYDRFGRPSGVYIPTNRRNTRYNTYNPAYYNYNRGLGTLKSYDRFGRAVSGYSR